MTKYYNRKKQSKNIIDDWDKIRRANDITRVLSKSSRHILSSVLYQINKYGHAVLTHYELSKITGTKHDQNCNLVKQLGFVLDITFERSIVINDKKYRDCYIFTKNENTDKILENPEEYFANLLGENSAPAPKKFGDIAEEIRCKTASLYIYNKKDKKRIDNHDNQYNQFSTYKNFSTENVETEGAKIVNAETVENSELPVAREECKVRKEYNTETVEQVETSIASDYVLRSTMETEEYTDEDDYIEANDFTDIPMEVLEPPTYEDDEEYEAKPESKPAKVKFVESPESLKGTQDITSYHRKQRTVETVGKDGKSYNSLRLDHLRLEEEMLQEAISRSNKPNYATSRVVVIIRNILEKRPDTLIFGGRKGAINYLIKAINGENDYEYKAQNPQTQEEKAQSMAEIQAEKQKAIDERYQMLLRGEVQSLSGAERYYG